MSIEAIRIIAGLVVSILCMVLWPRYIRLNAFFSLLFASILFALIVGIPVTEIIPTLQAGFGSLVQQIGIIIALGSVLGMVLEKTGAMEVISNGILHLFGSKRPVLAISAIGLMVGIPVFADSGFIILSRLIPTLALKTSTSQGSLVLALSSGLYTTHVMVPPTPGPLAAAANVGLGDQLGLVILMGLLASIPVAGVAYIFALKAGPRIFFEPEKILPQEKTTRFHWVRAFLPLMLPIILMGAGSLGKVVAPHNPVTEVLGVLGIPIVALLIGFLLSLTLIDFTNDKNWPDWISEALKDAGIIILITGAGGAFGTIIKASGIAELISAYASTSHMQGVFFLFLAWLLAAIIKTAQGSSTSSMIITSSLMAPLAASAGLVTPVDLSVLVVAIGGGSIAVSHANDSYFWVVTQFGRLTTRDSLGKFTPMTFVQGITALITAITIFLLL